MKLEIWAPEYESSFEMILGWKNIRCTTDVETQATRDDRVIRTRHATLITKSFVPFRLFEMQSETKWIVQIVGRNSQTFRYGYCLQSWCFERRRSIFVTDTLAGLHVLIWHESSSKPQRMLVVGIITRAAWNSVYSKTSLYAVQHVSVAVYSNRWNKLLSYLNK